MMQKKKCFKTNIANKEKNNKLKHNNNNNKRDKIASKQ